MSLLRLNFLVDLIYLETLNQEYPISFFVKCTISAFRIPLHFYIPYSTVKLVLDSEAVMKFYLLPHNLTAIFFHDLKECSEK